MTDRSVEVVMSELEERVREEGKQLDVSFRRRLASYSRETISDLTVEDQVTVLREVGRQAIDRAEPGEVVDEEDVSHVLTSLCDETFSDCRGAALRILEQD